MIIEIINIILTYQNASLSIFFGKEKILFPRHRYVNLLTRLKKFRHCEFLS